MRRVLGFVCFLATTSAWTEARADDAACVAAYDSSQRLRRDGKLSETRAALVICAQEECPTAVRKECTSWLREVNDALPTVIFGARDASGNDVSEARVLEGDRVVAERIDGREISLDPGEHVFVFVFPNGKRVERRVLIRQAEKNRLLDAAEPPSKKKAIVAEKPTPRATAKPTPAEKPGPPVAAIVLGSLGVVAIGTFAVLALDARSDLKELEDSCAPGCDQADVDRAHRKALIADISLGVGVLSLGAAGWLWLDHGKGQPTANGALGPRPQFTFRGQF